MKLPIIARWEAGDQPNDVLFNELMDVVNFLNKPPEGHFTQASPVQSIPNITWTPVNFNTVVKDTEAEYDPKNPMWSTTNPSRVYARTRGWYEIEIFTSLANTADNLRRVHSILQDGTDLGNMRAEYYQKTAGSNKIRTCYDMYLDVGSYLELLVWQETGGNLNLVDGGTTGSRTALRMKWYSL